MHTEGHDNIPPEEVKKRKRFFLWVERIMATLILLTFAIVLSLHIPGVQRWGVNKLTTAISRKLNTRVSIDGFSFNPISDLTLNKILISSPEHPSDTLMFADRLNVDYKRIWDIFSRRITISQIGIDKGFLNIHRMAGDSLTNLDIALLRLLPPRNPNKTDFVLDLKSLSAKLLRVRVDDETSGTLMDFSMKRADIQIDTLNIVNKYISIADLDLDGPEIQMINRLPIGESIAGSTASTKSWSINVDSWRLTNGKIRIDNRTKPALFYPNGRGIDYAHMVLEDLDLRMDSLIIRGWDFKAKDIDIHALHQNGFEINTLAATRAAISREGIILDDLEIRTPESEIKNSISLLFSGYTDFKSFVDSVRLVVPEANIRLHVNDLLAIAPGLQNVDFFMDNADKDINLQGKVSGHVNRLRIKNMNAGLGKLSLTGDFKSRDISVPGSQLISLDLERSAFSAAALKSIFPKMKIPPVLDKLGQINFTGDFDGYPDDFVAFGTFNTSLGKVTLDMNMNIVQGIADGQYSGSIALQDFDLGTFTGNKDLGRVTMSGRVIEGHGLSGESLYADITGQLSSLGYKGYIYHDARVDGQVTGKLFSGTMDINDPNVDMHFEGTVDMRDSLPRLDFISRIDSINFGELGLSKQPMTFKGILNVNLYAGRLDQLEGSIYGEKIVLDVKDVDYALDSLQLTAALDSTSGDRVFNISSDILSGTISGYFDPLVLPLQMQYYLHDKYPRTFDLPDKELKKQPKQRLSWDLTLHDSKHWFDLAGVDSLRLVNASTRGRLNLAEGTTSGTINLPALHLNNISAYGAYISFSEDNGRATADLELTAADLNENFFFEDVFIKGLATNDSVRLNFKTDQLADIVDELNLDINLDPLGENWSISLNPVELAMFGNDWSIPKGNKIEIRKGEFNLENFELVSKDQKIILDDINHKGLEAYISGFDISYLNEIWINDKFDFFGVYTLDFEVDNLYDIRQMEAVLNLPALKVNNVPYGQMVLNAVMNDPKDSVRINLSLINNTTTLIGKGAYVPPIKSIPKADQNYLRLDVTATEFPLDFLEFLLGGNIRDTEGSVDMTLSLKGKTNALNPNGKGKVYNGSTVIDYLGAAYSFHDQSFTITESMIDLSGCKLYDVQGNIATVEGGLTHRYLRNLGLNATLRSDKIVGLDVTSEENNIFYGKGIGSVYARFTGTVANPRMVINTTTAKGTHIYIPLTGGSAESVKDFAVFLENGMLPVNTATPINFGGIDLTMNMTITEDAIVELIFDENTGEVLRGQGSGDLTLSMDRLGNFSMYGNYKIAKGDYLFTNFRIVRKPFELQPGGIIQWDGDPYNATLNVQAKYKDLSAPVYTLISEYITDPNGAQKNVYEQSKERTKVDLNMKLTGSLLHPDIGFDIAFPELSGELKGYTNSKVTTLKANENAMFQQVVGLLITRSFLPTTSGTSSGLLLSEGLDNTLSELISATLSSYLGGLLGNLIPTGDVLSGITFQMNLDLPLTQGTVGEQANPLEDPNATVVEVSLPLEFFNDRLEVKVGGDYVTGATTLAKSEYFAGDVTFGYKLTPDGRLKIRAYNENTLTVEGRKNKVGVGLAYRREYDSFAEFLGKKPKAK